MIKKALILIAIILYILAVIFFRKHKAWLSYYLLGAFGLTLILIFGIKYLGLEAKIQTAEMYLIQLIASRMGIKSQVVGGGSIMISDSIGQLILQMGIESSAILESSALTGLILFYPAFTWQRKLSLLAIGLLITAIANLIRVLIIVGMAHSIGRGAIFLAHAVVGRLFFFACVIGLFWYIVTRPTVEEVSKLVRQSD